MTSNASLSLGVWRWMARLGMRRTARSILTSSCAAKPDPVGWNETFEARRNQAGGTAKKNGEKKIAAHLANSPAFATVVVVPDENPPAHPQVPVEPRVPQPAAVALHRDLHRPARSSVASPRVRLDLEIRRVGVRPYDLDPPPLRPPIPPSYRDPTVNATSADLFLVK